MYIEHRLNEANQYKTNFLSSCWDFPRVNQKDVLEKIWIPGRFFTPHLADNLSHVGLKERLRFLGQQCCNGICREFNVWKKKKRVKLFPLFFLAKRSTRVAKYHIFLSYLAALYSTLLANLKKKHGRHMYVTPWYKSHLYIRTVGAAKLQLNAVISLMWLKKYGQAKWNIDILDNESNEKISVTNFRSWG